MDSSTRKGNNGLRRGVIVFSGLLILSLLEYWIAIGMASAMALLVLIMIAKAVLIVDNYMHLRSITETVEGEH